MTRLPSVCMMMCDPATPVPLSQTTPEGPYSTKFPSVCMIASYRPSVDHSAWPAASDCPALSW